LHNISIVTPQPQNDHELPQNRISQVVFILIDSNHFFQSFQNTSPSDLLSGKNAFLFFIKLKTCVLRYA